jgi:hypothetical protein
MCGTSESQSGWDTTDGSGGQQNNVNVIEGYLAEMQSLTGNAGGIYIGVGNFQTITGSLWPSAGNPWIYWQAGGCSPITSNCHFTTQTAISPAQSLYIQYRCSETVSPSDTRDRMVLWQYDPNISGTGDLDTTAQMASGNPGDAFQVGVNGC